MNRPTTLGSEARLTAMPRQVHNSLETGHLRNGHRETLRYGPKRKATSASSTKNAGSIQPQLARGMAQVSVTSERARELWPVFAQRPARMHLRQAVLKHLRVEASACRRIALAPQVLRPPIPPCLACCARSFFIDGEPALAGKRPIRTFSNHTADRRQSPGLRAIALLRADGLPPGMP